MSIVTGEDRPREARGGIRSAVRIRVELWLAVVLMAVAFAAGIAVRAMYEPPQAAVSVTSTDQSSGQVTLAPPLTDTQIQQGLPPGHPDLSGGQDTGAGSGKSGQSQGSKASQGGDASSSGSP
jgi:hypothetical protein